MDRKKIVALVLILAVIVGIGIVFAQATPPRNIERWEYFLITTSDPAVFRQRANELGADGWELQTASGIWWVFKRRLP